MVEFNTILDKMHEQQQQQQQRSVAVVDSLLKDSTIAEKVSLEKSIENDKERAANGGNGKKVSGPLVLGTGDDGLFDDYSAFLDLNPEALETHLTSNASLFNQSLFDGLDIPSMIEAFPSTTTTTEKDKVDIVDIVTNSIASSIQDHQQQLNVNADLATQQALSDLTSSVASTLLSSFSTPALAPSSTQTQIYSDFSSPDAPVLGDMFPTLYSHQNGSAHLPVSQTRGEHSRPEIAHRQSSTNAVDHNLLSQYGCEPAFDDVDMNALGEHGVFSLPLFGGLPAAGAGGVQTATSPASFATPALAAAAYHASGMAIQHSARASPLIQQAASPQEVCISPGSLEKTDSSSSVLTLSRIPGMMTPVAAAALPPLSEPSSSPQFELAHDLFDNANGVDRSSGKAGSSANKKGRKKPYEPNGTRSSRPLLDADAPTMAKTYAAPGKTTRKAIPVGFQKKLKLQTDLNGDAVLPSELGDQAQAVMEEIEEKRRKNCVAARESRRRKQEYMNGLKDEIRSWRSWAVAVEAALRSAGLEEMLDDLPERPESVDLDE